MKIVIVFALSLTLKSIASNQTTNPFLNMAASKNFPRGHTPPPGPLDMKGANIKQAFSPPPYKGNICPALNFSACSEHKSRICDESKNILGPSKCAADVDCSSGRTCQLPAGTCQGMQDFYMLDCARTKVCKNSWLPACTSRFTRICNENLNTGGAKRCQTPLDCSFGKYCSSFGWCTGNSLLDMIDCPANTVCASTYLPACSDHFTQICDETKNTGGSGKCAADNDCAQGRTCVSGACQGTQTYSVVQCFLKVDRLPEKKSLNIYFCKGSQLRACTDNFSKICDEQLNSWGPSRCNGHNNCNIGRKCNKDGNCEGQSTAQEINCLQ